MNNSAKKKFPWFLLFNLLLLNQSLFRDHVFPVFPTFSSNKHWWRLRAFSFLGRRTRESCVALPPKGRLRQAVSAISQSRSHTSNGLSDNSLWHLRLGHMSEKGLDILRKWGLLGNHKIHTYIISKGINKGTKITSNS